MQAAIGIRSEADVMTDDSPSMNVTETVTSIEQTPVTSMIGVSASELKNGNEQTTDLDRFFARPITIYDGTWAAGTQQDVNLEAWLLWSMNQAVRAKISNYAYFKGNLHCKVSLTGTPFHYGLVQVSYQPYALMNSTLVAYDDMLTGTVPVPAVVRPAYHSYLSQSLGCEYINLSENEPVELTIPFMAPKGAFRLFNNIATVITATTELADFYAAGEVRLSTINAPAVANEDYAATVSVNVSVWMTEVELSGITSTNVDIVAESKLIRSEGKKKKQTKSFQTNKKSGWKEKVESSINYATGPRDEYADPGPVEQVASAVSKIGNALADVPVIGSFAKATGWAAGQASKLAGLFGWSKPIILDTPIFAKNQPYTNGAVCSGHDTAQKLSLDPKQETSIDASFCTGTTEDELTIMSIASKESYLTTTTWANTQVALTDYLFECAVTPMLYNSFVDGGFDVFQPTAMSFATTPFRFWRGSITFRIEVVCSKFHRGKLAIMFEPNVAQWALIRSNSTVLNEQNTVILDIQEAQEMEFTVDWCNSRSWLRAEIKDAAAERYWSTDDTIPVYQTPQNSMGMFSIQCLNELVQPTDLSTVPINIYVRCDDLNVAEIHKASLPTQREYVITESNVLAQHISETSADMENLHLAYFGEKILSFRQILKRVQPLHYIVGNYAGGAAKVAHSLFLPIHPSVEPKYGKVAAGNTYTPYPNMYNYLRYAFLGLRGSVRYHVRYTGTIAGALEAGLEDYPTVLRVANATFTAAPVASSTAMTTEPGVILTLSDLDGAVHFHQSTNGGIEFEVPYYSENLFEFSNNTGLGKDSTAQGLLVDDDTFLDTATGVKVTFPQQTTAASAGAWVVDMSIGEDFTFMRFTGAPFYTNYVPA
jgi:hypothetical protein